VVGRALGEGGGGVVFAAHDRRANVSVALKFLPPALASKPIWLRRLAREMELARRIRHPNACPVLDFRQGEGRAFIVLELAVGSLFDERGATEAVPERPEIWHRRTRDAAAVCAGLAAIHDAGVVHRDIKPANILRMPDGRLVVADFGMAVGAGETVTCGGGTPNYLPPEVNLGEVHDLRADVWQLGVLLHEILFGCRPRWRSGGRRPFAPAIPAGVPRNVARWVRVAKACLTWDPATRPASATVVARLLK
jgi:serine/threonine-protein kinase